MWPTRQVSLVYTPGPAGQLYPHCGHCVLAGRGRRADKIDQRWMHVGTACWLAGTGSLFTFFVIIVSGSVWLWVWGLHCDQHSSVITAQWDGSLLTPATSCYCHCGHNPLSPRIIIVLIRKYDDAERVSWCHVVLPCVFVCKKCSWCELC